MQNALRRVAGVVAGVILAGMIISGFEMIGAALFPLPKGVSPADPKALAAAMSQLPTGAFLIVLAGWFFGALAASVVATRFGRSAGAGVVAAFVLLCLSIRQMQEFAHPLWFQIASVVAFAVAGWLGTSVAQVANEAAARAAVPPPTTS